MDTGRCGENADTNAASSSDAKETQDFSCVLLRTVSSTAVAGSMSDVDGEDMVGSKGLLIACGGAGMGAYL